MATKRTEWVRPEDVRVGDVIEVFGRERRVTSISTYRGPLVGIISHLVSWDVGPCLGMSLARGHLVEIRERVS